MTDLVEFIAGTGVRISEAISLDCSDVTITAPAGIPTMSAVVTSESPRSKRASGDSLCPSASR